MMQFLDGAWALVKILSYGGLALALAGVAVFGWYFIRLNARAVHGDETGIPREAWRGKGARLGIRMLGLGAVMQIASIALSVVLPGRL